MLGLGAPETCKFPLEQLTLRSNAESLTEPIVLLVHGVAPCGTICAQQIAPRYRSARLWQNQRPDDGHISVLNKTALTLA